MSHSFIDVVARGVSNGGSQDITAALQQLVNNEGFQNVYYFKPGVYRVNTSSPLFNFDTPAKQGNKIIGDGPFRTQFMFYTNTPNLVSLHSSGTGFDAGGFSVGMAPGYEPTGGTILDIHEGGKSRLHDIVIQKAYRGIMADGPLTISECELLWCKWSALEISCSGMDVWVRDTRINAGGENNFSYGLGGNIRIANCVVALHFDSVESVFGKYPLYVQGVNWSNGYHPFHSHFSKCYFDSCGFGAYFDYAQFFTFDSCWFGGNGRTQAWGPQSGMKLNNFMGSKFHKCTFTANGAHGVDQTTLASDLDYADCDFIDNGQSLPANYGHGLCMYPYGIRTRVRGGKNGNPNFNCVGNQAVGIWLGSGQQGCAIQEDTISWADNKWRNVMRQ